MRKPYLPPNIRIKERMSWKFKMAMISVGLIAGYLVSFV